MFGGPGFAIQAEDEKIYIKAWAKNKKIVRCDLGPLGAIKVSKWACLCYRPGISKKW